MFIGHLATRYVGVRSTPAVDRRPRLFSNPSNTETLMADVNFTAAVEQTILQ